MTTKKVRQIKLYKFDLIQGGLVTASVESLSREQALKEINHYALMYSIDGPVQIKERKHRRRGAKRV